jgi:uncharacterized protein YukE
MTADDLPFYLPPSPTIPTQDLVRKFWDLIDKYDRLVDKYRLPTPKLRPILTQFSLIESDYIQRVGETYWGTGGEHTGLPGELASELPTKIEAAVGKAAERWKGDAFDAYRKWMTNLQEILGRFTEPSQQVGETLAGIADSFRLTKIEIIGALVSIGGLIIALAALAVPEPVATKALAAIVAGVSLVLAAIALLVSAVSSWWPRLEAAQDAVDTLTGELLDKIPNAPDESIVTPDPGGWQAKTPDPAN